VPKGGWGANSSTNINEEYHLWVLITAFNVRLAD
jgi:hypothetical protein